MHILQIKEGGHPERLTDGPTFPALDKKGVSRN